MKHLPLIWALFVVALGAWWHYEAGFSLPLPCGDEVVFYYPAQALAHAGELRSDHLLPSRALFWMPPGYMAVLAPWLTAFGNGLGPARWLSFVLAAFAFVGMQNFCLRMKLPVEGLLLVAVAFLSKNWVVMGNMTRMEGLFLCLIWLALWAVWEGKTLAAFGLLFLTGTVHPNAVYFLIALPVFALLAPKRGFGGWFNFSLFMLGCSIAGLYGFYVLENWEAFRFDWRWQFSTRDFWLGVRILLLRADQALFFAGVSGLAYWAWRKKKTNVGFVLLVAISFWGIRIIGQGWNYGVFNVIAVTLVVGCALLWAREEVWPNLRWVPKGLPWVAPLVMVPILSLARVYTLPFVSRESYMWMGMGMQTKAVPFIIEADVVAIRKALYARLPNRQNKVYFMGEGEGMIFAPQDTGRILHVLPVFGQNLPEYVVVHETAVGDFYRPEIEEVLEILPTHTLPAPIYERQGAEKWYLIKIKDGRYPGFIMLPGDKRLEGFKM